MTQVEGDQGGLKVHSSETLELDQLHGMQSKNSPKKVMITIRKSDEKPLAGTHGD